MRQQASINLRGSQAIDRACHVEPLRWQLTLKGDRRPLAERASNLAVHVKRLACGELAQLSNRAHRSSDAIEWESARQTGITAIRLPVGCAHSTQQSQIGGLGIQQGLEVGDKKSCPFAPASSNGRACAAPTPTEFLIVDQAIDHQADPGLGLNFNSRKAMLQGIKRAANDHSRLVPMPVDELHRFRPPGSCR